MTDTTNTEAKASKKPTHTAYHVREREGKDAVWTRIGAAWPHADGKGLNVEFDVAPLNGRITLRVPSDKKE